VRRAAAQRQKGADERDEFRESSCHKFFPFANNPRIQLLELIRYLAVDWLRREGV
jgi:hypothetical protein